MNSLTGIKIAGTGSYTPSKVVTSQELADKLGSDVDWILQNLGIVERRIAEPNQFSSDLGAEAATAALDSAGIDREQLDLIIVATATPDRRAPSTACLIQEKLQIKHPCPAFDMNAVCSGFLYSLTVAANLIKSGAYRNILIVGVDTFSKITDWSRRDCVFFGDGAGAVVLQATNDNRAFFSSDLYADGSGKESFTVKPEDSFFTMDGRAVYETGTKVLPEAIKKVLSTNALSVSDLSMIIPHQPSIRLLKKTAEILELPFSKIKINMDRFANTASATVPLLLDQVNKRGEIKDNDLIAFAAVGSGWTWGAALLRWI